MLRRQLESMQFWEKKEQALYHKFHLGARGGPPDLPQLTPRLLPEHLLGLFADRFGEDHSVHRGQREPEGKLCPKKKTSDLIGQLPPLMRLSRKPAA